MDRRSQEELKKYPHEVQISHAAGTAYLNPTYELVDWLNARRLDQYHDWILDMFGGELSYTSFYFKEADEALLTKLTWGGK